MTLKEKIEEFSREAWGIDSEEIADALDKLDIKNLTSDEEVAFCGGVEWICNNIIDLMERFKIDIKLD